MKILWFIKGEITDRHIEQARKEGLIIRSADAYHDGDFIEVCDAVKGDVPKVYADLYGQEMQKSEQKQKKPAEGKQ